VPSFLAASDVLGTGWFGAVAAQAGPGKTVAVVGDGAAGLLATDSTVRPSCLGCPVSTCLDRDSLRPSRAGLLHGGPAPVRRLLPELMDLIWNRRIDPGKVFDLELPLDQTAAGYQAMDARQAIKVLLRP
jgi:threonine dehydrogenase-like Zn-dependent dehydrogenase